MFVAITNTPRDYAWGSRRALAELLGRKPSGGPEAELWLGAHPLAPSRIVDPGAADGHATLDRWIAADPERALGPDRSGDTLPFLLKVLAADEPLSIQAHPSPEQAREGFERETSAGVPSDADRRVYRDDRHKPELVVALGEAFEVLAGFRDPFLTRQLLEELEGIARDAGAAEDADRLSRLAGALDEDDEAVLRRMVALAFEGSEEAEATIGAVARAARRAPRTSPHRLEFETLAELQDRHPGDPGILVALLMNRVSLPEGQGLYLPSGNIHAYLRGLAVEIMAASDNVVRGGLTSKHIDTRELQKVVRFSPVPPPFLEAEEAGPGVRLFRPDVPDFLLARVDLRRNGEERSATSPASVLLPGPGIVLAIGGTTTVTGGRSSAVIGPGQAAFVTPDEAELRLEGTGTVFVATVNR
ncbi:mannose-6-phosphate isomerase, class I [Naasia sp. SYSU D00948]|uniref:mannose-6-phosphate isomerase, class I n=1 Tax=Naasia sp. SYSU D00948 TaxID=2817379 RepID=UPI001B303A48|nr:mannose-6-phosphate isomerase, class I [Naasia sp. SYSU D00948]